MNSSNICLLPELPGICRNTENGPPPPSSISGAALENKPLLSIQMKVMKSWVSTNVEVLRKQTDSLMCIYSQTTQIFKLRLDKKEQEALDLMFVVLRADFMTIIW